MAAARAAELGEAQAATAAEVGEHLEDFRVALQDGLSKVVGGVEEDELRLKEWGQQEEDHASKGTSRVQHTQSTHRAHSTHSTQTDNTGDIEDTHSFLPTNSNFVRDH